MKKIFVILSAALMFAACSKNDVIVPVEEDETAIDFSAVADKTTKAAINDNADLAKEGGFVVWGYKNAKTATDWTSATTIFDAQTVTAAANDGAYVSGNVTNWTYTPKRFWDKNANYCFYAVAPVSPANGTYSIAGNANEKKITIDGAVSAISTASDDHLISRAGVIGRDGKTTDNVAFTFNHVMAKLTFKVKLQDKLVPTDLKQIEVKEITMTGWNNGAGKFVQTATTTPATIECNEWNIATAADGNIILVGTGASQTSIVLTPETGDTNTPTEITDWYIMVPQAIAYTAASGDAAAKGLTFNVKYTMTLADNTTTEDFEVSGVVPASQTWGTDSYTNYTIIVGPEPIEFDVVSVAGFTNDGGDQTVTVQ